MALRDVRLIVRNRQSSGGSLPANALYGEPFVNLYDGVLRFSGITGGSFEASNEVGVFEVGSKLYNQTITNRLNINSNFIISGGTGLISTYGGVSGAGLAGKFLSGTTSGFVLGNISDISAASAGASGDVQFNNGSGGFGADSSFNYNDSLNILRVQNLSGTTVSGGTYYSGSTPLETIIYNIANGVDTNDITRVQPGSNINTGGTGNLPIVSVVASPSFNNLSFSGTATGAILSATTISGGTFYSGSTNLGTVITNLLGTLDATYVQNGVNTFTGGTSLFPSVNITGASLDNIFVSGSSRFNNLSGGTLSGGTLYSGSTNLETIIYNIASSTELNDITRVQPGSNISTGGTANEPTVNLVASPSINGLSFSGTATGSALSATTLSGGTIYSGTSLLETIIYNIASSTELNDITRVQPGYNIVTGGTANAPVVSIVGSPSFSGTVTATGVTVSNLTPGRVVYVGSSSVLKDESGFEYNDALNLLKTPTLQVGNNGDTGITTTIYGNVLFLGDAISGFTSELYIEDNTIEINYNPTASTESTSLGSGWYIQDGSGVAGTDAIWDVRGSTVGLSGRSLTTNMYDIRIRESGTVSSPNGMRVLAEQDTLDGGSY